MHQKHTQRSTDKVSTDLVEAIVNFEDILECLIKNTSDHSKIIRIYREETETNHRNSAVTKGILVGVRGIIGVPTRGSDRNNLSRKIGDLRDFYHDLVGRVNVVDAIVTTLKDSKPIFEEYFEIFLDLLQSLEKKPGRSDLSSFVTKEEYETNNWRIFSLFEILRKKIFGGT